ncbi:restriction endonuclease subunit S [[Clostridium] innocuum]|uniref:restriction endonuclease subunit S n=1 Tax=Clostridium innocuum TaxID=1522 RepID=UPI001FF4BB1B|nr:restriction endonuclease subunit S [[Clostridium] innocuum]UOX48958.1 restriction endonuclease subunit S [[Clostridium] innocuum]
MAFVWEQRKLGEVAKYRNGKAHENCIDDDGKYIVVNSKFVSTNGKVKKFSNMQNEPLFENEVAFVLSDVPNGRAIARTFLVEKSDKYTLNQRIAGITPLNETDPYYLHVLMNRHPYFLAFDDGVKQTNLSVSDVMKFESYYPKYEEQETIGRCFSQLDQLITLHQRKRMLRRCFFSIDWEQRKVSEIADRFDNLRVPVAANLRTPGTTPYYGANGIQDYVEGYTHDGEFVLVAEDGANDLKNYPVKCVNGRIWVNNHAHVLQARPQIASNQFLAYSMSQANIEALLVGGGRAKLNAEVMMGIVLRIPRLQEQEVIGGYFYKLDQLITLHQCKSNFCKKNEVNAWEQRKFVEFVKNAAKKNKDNIDLEPYAVTNDRGFIAQKDAHDDFGYMSNVDRTAYNIVPPNSFAYNPARINVGSLGYYEGTENVIVSSLYEVFQTEEYIDDKFLLHWFKSDSFPRWIEKLQEGSVRLYFYFDKLVQCQMMVPSLEEQKRISAYLDSIDQLITLHQWECNINENTEGNDEKQRKPIKKLIISEGNLSLVDDMFLLHRMTFLVCNKYILLRLNVVKYKITIIIISNILYSIVSLLIIACYLIVINKQLIILIYVEISVVIIKGDDDYARIRS